MCPKRVLRVSEWLMPLSIATILVAGYIGFVDHDAWSLSAQVVAHISIMLGAAFLKLSYMMYLNASMHLGINDFAFMSAGSSSLRSDSSLPACCLTS